jgi:hypothetical protein
MPPDAAFTEEACAMMRLTVRPGRRSSRYGSSRLIAMLVVAAAVSSCGGGAPSSARLYSPTASASVFADDLLPYAIVLPTAWQLVQRDQEANGTENPTFLSPDGNAEMEVLWSLGIPEGTLAQRVEYNRTKDPGCTSDKTADEATQLAAIPAVRIHLTCGETAYVEVIALRATDTFRLILGLHTAAIAATGDAISRAFVDGFTLTGKTPLITPGP